MAWITTPPHTRKVIDDRDRLPFDATPLDGPDAAAADGPLSAEAAAAQTAAIAAGSGAHAPAPPAEPVQPRDSARYRQPVPKSPVSGVKPTTRVLRTLGGTGEPMKADERQMADLSVFRRYPALFHRMAAHKRGLAGVRLSFYDMLLIGALGALLIYLLVMAFSPAPSNPALPGAPATDKLTFPVE